MENSNMNSLTLQTIANYTQQIQYQRTIIDNTKKIIQLLHQSCEDICDHSFPDGSSGIHRDEDLGIWCGICGKKF